MFRVLFFVLVAIVFASCSEDEWKGATEKFVQTINNIKQKSKLWKTFNEKYQQKYKSLFPQTIMLPMSDGVHLHTTYWSGLDGVKRETVIVRSPYGVKATENLADLFVPFGYAVVLQDQRGTGQSEGNWTYWTTAPTDGQTTMNWIHGQPWSNGVVHQMGASADGILTYLDMRVSQPYMGGQWIILSTSLLKYTVFEGAGAYRKNLVEQWLDLIHRSRPDAPDYVTAVIEHEGETDYWLPRMLLNFTNIDFLSISTSGWYDIFTQYSIESFNNYNRYSAPNVRGKHQLIIGPLGHCEFNPHYNHNITYDGQDMVYVWSYESALEVYSKNDAKLHQEILDVKATLPNKLNYTTFYVIGPSTYFLNETEKEMKKSSPEAFVGNYWSTAQSLPQSSPFLLYLTDRNSLTPTPIPVKKNFTYIYDPHNPVPTMGGNNLFLPCGAMDQRPTESRPDVLVFTSAPLAQPLAVTGNFKVNLTVSSNCTDTDFTVKITDVYPGTGASVLLSDELLRMRWRVSEYNPPTPMQPGQTYQIQIETWPISYIFNQGHQIRLAISSSNFPKYSATPNNGMMVYQGGPTIIAENTIIVGGGFSGSSLTLPVVSLSQIPNNIINA